MPGFLIAIGFAILSCLGIVVWVAKWLFITAALAYFIVMFTPEDNLKRINEHINSAKEYITGER